MKSATKHWLQLAYFQRHLTNISRVAGMVCFKCRKRKVQKENSQKTNMLKQLGKELRSAINAGKQDTLHGIVRRTCPKMKCFKCDQTGHIGANCKSPKTKAKALPKAKPKANTKGSPRKTTKGKGMWGTFFKKGKSTIQRDENGLLRVPPQCHPSSNER